MVSAKKIKSMVDRLRDWAREISFNVHALYLAARDPRVPWYAKAVALSVAAYALSPIDLIPDFIPVVGHLDDMIIVPLGIWLAVRLIPADVLEEHRATARQTGGRPVGKTAPNVVTPSGLATLSLGSPALSSNSQITSPRIEKAQ